MAVGLATGLLAGVFLCGTLVFLYRRRHSHVLHPQRSLPGTPDVTRPRPRSLTPNWEPTASPASCPPSDEGRIFDSRPSPRTHLATSRSKGKGRAGPPAINRSEPGPSSPSPRARLAPPSAAAPTSPASQGEASTSQDDVRRGPLSLHLSSKGVLVDLPPL